VSENTVLKPFVTADAGGNVYLRSAERVFFEDVIGIKRKSTRTKPDG
jgi:hypothetical protein